MPCESHFDGGVIYEKKIILDGSSPGCKDDESPQLPGACSLGIGASQLPPFPS